MSQWCDLPCDVTPLVTRDASCDVTRYQSHGTVCDPPYRGSHGTDHTVDHMDDGHTRGDCDGHL